MPCPAPETSTDLPSNPTLAVLGTAGSIAPTPVGTGAAVGRVDGPATPAAPAVFCALLGGWATSAASSVPAAPAAPAAPGADVASGTKVAASMPKYTGTYEQGANKHDQL